MTDIYTLPCAQRANVATAARLLSCLVTESLVQAFYVPLKGFHDKTVTGLVVVLNSQASENGIDIPKELYRTDILAVVPLRNVPIFKPDAKQSERGTPVGLLDPLDMYPCIFTIQTYDFEADTSLVSVALRRPPCSSADTRQACSLGRADAVRAIRDGHAEYERMHDDGCGCSMGSICTQSWTR